LGADHAKWISSGCLGSGVRGSVIHNDDFVIRIIEPEQSLKAILNCARAIVGTHHDGDPRPIDVRGERRFIECFRNRLQRCFGLTLWRGYAERPILNVVAPAMPFVRPAENESSTATLRKRRPHLPVEDFRLLLFSVTLAVEPEFRKNDWPVSRNVVNVRDIV